MYSAAVRETELEERSRIEEDAWISDVITREQGRLRAYIRNKLGSTSDIEDVLQDVFYEFVLARRSLKQIEHVGAWLFSVARNRVTDLFRKTKVMSLDEGRARCAWRTPADRELAAFPERRPGPDIRNPSVVGGSRTGAG